MKLYQKILLLPSVLPFIAILLISGSNLNEKTEIRILTWKTPNIRIGILMSIAATSAALTAGIATYSLGNNKDSLRRKVVINYSHEEQYIKPSGQIDDYPQNIASTDDQSFGMTPERDVRDPSPTIAVPYRYIRRSVSTPPLNEIYESETDNLVYDREKEYESSNDSEEYIINDSYTSNQEDGWGKQINGDW